MNRITEKRIFTDRITEKGSRSAAGPIKKMDIRTIERLRIKQSNALLACQPPIRRRKTKKTETKEMVLRNSPATRATKRSKSRNKVEPRRRSMA